MMQESGGAFHVPSTTLGANGALQNCKGAVMNHRQPPTNAVPGAPTVRLQGYDVLLLPSGTDPAAPLRFAPGNDVGNRRFRVLLSLFRRRYLAARSVGDEAACASVAGLVLETVCDRCVPHGRFFVQHEGGWRQFERDGPATVRMVQRALELEPVESSAPPKREQPAPFLEMLCQAAEGKAPLRDESEEEPGPFDVVCDAEGKGLAKERGYTGNNRLKILLAIRMRSYRAASGRRGKRKIAKEVVSSVLDEAGGRYLRCDASGRYEILPRKDAVECTQRAFDAANRRMTRKRKRKDCSEAQKMVQRKHKRAILNMAEKTHREGRSKGVKLFAGAIVPNEAFSSRVVTHREVVPKAA
ncbi:hypothetical protein ACHAXT_012878 [Thalassiosira profunda]